MRAHTQIAELPKIKRRFILNDTPNLTYQNYYSLTLNKAVKNIGRGKYMDHATPFYSKLKILKIPKLNIKLPKWHFTIIIAYHTVFPSSRFFSASQRFVGTRTNNFWQYGNHSFKKFDKFLEI